MKKINYLITGGQGFIGYNFIKKLDEMENTGIIVSLDKISDISIRTQPEVKYGPFQLVRGHTSDSDVVFNILKLWKIDVVVDFAASSHVDVSIQNPDVFIEDNILGKYGMIKACLEWQKINESFKLINISTDEVFGALEPNEDCFTEMSRLSPTNPYSASKASADILVDAHVKTFGLRAITTHCCNNYGPWQDCSKLIPKVIQCLLNGFKIPIYGEGLQRREWIHVNDHCEAILHILNLGDEFLGQHFNIGTGVEISNIDLVHKIMNIAKKMYNIDTDDMIEFVEDRPAHDFRYALDFSKISATGWKPKKHFDDGIAETIKWYHETMAQ